MTNERFARASAFEREIMRRTSTLVEPFAYGTAYLNAELPCRYGSNLLWVDADARPASADALVAEADRILGGAGLSHRKVNADGEVGLRLVPRFLALGWSVDHLVTMALQRPPDRPPDVEVRTVGFAAVRGLLEAGVRAGEASLEEACVRQLVEHKRVLEERAGARFFVARLDGRDAGACEMYRAGAVAQIEDVETLEAFRGRGAARAVILEAARAARAEGAELVFLVADDDDWPKRLYGRLGFDAVGDAWEFIRAPTA